MDATHPTYLNNHAIDTYFSLDLTQSYNTGNVSDHRQNSTVPGSDENSSWLGAIRNTNTIFLHVNLFKSIGMRINLAVVRPIAVTIFENMWSNVWYTKKFKSSLYPPISSEALICR